jgi:hypothetical protein
MNQTHIMSTNSKDDPNRFPYRTFNGTEQARGLWIGAKSRFSKNIFGEPDSFIPLNMMEIGSPNKPQEIINWPARGF